MNNKIFMLLAGVLISTTVSSQNQEVNTDLNIKRTPEPFLFSVTTLTPEDFITAYQKTSMGELKLWGKIWKVFGTKMKLKVAQNY